VGSGGSDNYMVGPAGMTIWQILAECGYWATIRPRGWWDTFRRVHAELKSNQLDEYTRDGHPLGTAVFEECEELGREAEVWRKQRHRERYDDVL